MRELQYLAMDFGTSAGRGILGSFDGNELKLQEIHRFRNYYVDNNGTLFWDVFRFVHEMEAAMDAARRQPGVTALSGIGIDTWGTDFGLIDKNGLLLGNCRCVKNTDGRGVREVSKKIPPEQLFAHTGLQCISGNTVFQLYERLLMDDVALLNADKMLMLPDLLAYFLTGEQYTEYTMATTSMLYNPLTRGWDMQIVRELGLPAHIFPQIIGTGSAAFPVRRQILEMAGIRELDYIPVGTHDTASAVAAAPLEQDEAFCSSGTWSLLGTELEAPLMTPEVFRENFANEGTVDGKIRLLKNIMGMWVLQQCMDEWHRQGLQLDWDGVVGQALAAKPFRSFIDLDAPSFYLAGNMAGKVQAYCASTSQPVPETVGEIARCVYESIAMRYRMALEQLERLTNKRICSLRIVGGGCQNRLLNQFAANATKRRVSAGPAECACAGNILMQAAARGEVAGLAQIREIVRRSFPTEYYEPEAGADWDAAYEAYASAVG